MHSRKQPQYKADFDEVLELLKKQGMVPTSPPPGLVDVAKTIHRYTYSLILWRFRLRDLPEHGSVFLDELSSDALQVLPHVLLGFNKSASLLIRGIQENGLRHLYFSDHPVEFARLNRDTKWYISNEMLFDYARNHFDFIDVEKKFDCLAQISSLYSQMSEGVHGRTVRHLEQRDALANIKFDLTRAKKHSEAIVKTAQAVNFMLAIYHRQQMRQFTTEDRSLILRTLPTEARRVWTEHQ